MLIKNKQTEQLSRDTLNLFGEVEDGGTLQSETSNQIIFCASWSRDICARPFHICERKSHTINVTGLILVSNFKRLGFMPKQ